MKKVEWYSMIYENPILTMLLDNSSIIFLSFDNLIIRSKGANKSIYPSPKLEIRFRYVVLQTR